MDTVNYEMANEVSGAVNANREKWKIINEVRVQTKHTQRKR